MDFVTTGINSLAFDLGKAPAKVIAGAAVAIAKTAHAIEADAKLACPVDTGNLRSSISTSAVGLYAEVGPTAEYARYVEEGTSTQGPQPFMRPAYEKNTPALVSAIDQILGGIL